MSNLPARSERCSSQRGSEVQLHQEPREAGYPSAEDDDDS